MDVKSHTSGLSKAEQLAVHLPVQLHRDLEVVQDLVPTIGTQSLAPSVPQAATLAKPRASESRFRAPGRHGQTSSNIERTVIAGIDLLFLLPPLLLLFAPMGLVAVVAAATALTAWTVKGLYRRRITMSVLDDLPGLAAGVVISLGPAVVVGLAVTPPQLTSWSTIVQLAVVMMIAAVLSRSIGYLVIRTLRASGHLVHPTLLLGSGGLATMVAQRIESHPESGLRVVGTVTSSARQAASGLPYLGTPNDLARIVAENGISDVVVGYGSLRSFDLVDVLRTCDRLDAEIYIIPRFFEMASLSGDDDCLFDIPLRRVRRSAHRVITWRVKRLFDVAAALFAMLVLAPILLATALAVRLELGPGIIFKQTRIGLDGQSFPLMKFRSMRNLEAGASRGWGTLNSADRIGPVGRFIRRYSLDELPQFINVLRGEMSFVGPRPERPEYVEEFSRSVPRYVHRHRVPVGLTGLAAVNGLRGDTSIHDRAQLDNWYIENWSLWSDMKIMARTAIAVFRGTGA